MLNDNQDYLEFLNKIKKNNNKKGTLNIKFPVKNSYKYRDYFNNYRKYKSKNDSISINENLYSKIVKALNRKLRDILINEGSVILPNNLGELYIRKNINDAYFNKDNKLIIPYTVNWGDTLKLWYEDKSAYDNKILIRNTRHICKIIYKNGKKTYFKRNSYLANNMIFINFEPYRSLSITINNLDKEGLAKCYIADK